MDIYDKENYSNLKPISLKLPEQKKKETAHQTIVNAIIEVVGEHPRYNYVYWIGRIHRSKLSTNAILDLVDKAKGLDVKYNKGGFIGNRL